MLGYTSSTAYYQVCKFTWTLSSTTSSTCASATKVLSRLAKMSVSLRMSAVNRQNGTCVALVHGHVFSTHERSTEPGEMRCLAKVIAFLCFFRSSLYRFYNT